MNIVMMTNTFLPHIGGVARSVQNISHALRQRGHRVLIIAPEFEGMPDQEEGVLRLASWRHFSEGDFSVPAPLPGRVTRALNVFEPDIIHAHHPFLLGDSALRAGAARNLPVVFTHHTLYERYTHYLPGDSQRLQQFAIDLATGFANLCDAVIAPSQTVGEILAKRGVSRLIRVIPTGVDLDLFTPGDGWPLRKRLGIARDAFVVGHIGRLAPEKEPEFLATAVARFLMQHPYSHFLLAGMGPCAQTIENIFSRRDLSRRFHRLQSLPPDELVKAYRAMDVFVFASQSETQGMVLTEAMATATPVVAIEGSGVRDVVNDGYNGRLLPDHNIDQFIEALHWMAGLDHFKVKTIQANACITAEQFSLERSTEDLLELYQGLCDDHEKNSFEVRRWSSAKRIFDEEVKILQNLRRAAEDALRWRSDRS